MREFDINRMRAACRSAAETLRSVGPIIRPGITTDDINRHVHNHTVRQGGYPAPLNYKGFPKSVCTSVNYVVCHGIPGSYVLKEGDIVNVDVTTVLDGHFGDTSATFEVGNVDPEVHHLVALTQQALHNAIAYVRPGLALGGIGRVIQHLADNHNYGVVREFGGHGLGVRFHTSPHVNHFASNEESVILQPGMIFTIEPMLNLGTDEVWVASDGWTVRTVDGKHSAQFEHTILVTDDGAEVLTA